MSKRLPYPKFEGQTGERYWRSLREEADSPEFQAEIEREFPEGAAEPPEGVSRRDFFRYMSASMALAGVAACRRPDERILPYSRQPEEVIPGVPLYFATAMAWNGSALGLLVESHEGRPTKIEGNPRHPESLGATNTWAQAEVLSLYDPDRATSPREKGTPKSWDDASAALRALGAKHRGQNGKGFALLTESHRSPTTARMIQKLKEQFPEGLFFRYEAWSRQNAREGARLAFGKPLEPVLKPEAAKVILALDADFLMADGASDVRHTREFSGGRNRLRPGDMNRLYAVESTFSVTGAMADHRLRLRSREVTQFAVALARTLGVGGALPAVNLDQNASMFLAAVAKDLRQAAGGALVTCGEKQPAVVHALVHAVNAALGAVGKTVSFVAPFDATSDGPDALLALSAAIADKKVQTLVILGGNPVFNGPDDARIAERLREVETSVHLTTHVDETSDATTWSLPRAHFLESWSDVRALDGTTAIVQPLIAPLFDGKTDAEVVALLLGEPARAYDLVRATLGPASDLTEKAWRKALHDGVLPGSAAPAETITAATAGLDAAVGKALEGGAGDYEVTFVPDAHAWDGRFANNGWTQENPDPMTKLTWGNAALISPTTAKELGVSDGDLVTLTTGSGKPVTLPALIAVGQADKSLTVSFGQGRTVSGRVGQNVGVNTNPLRTSAGFGVAAVKVVKAGGSEKLARTQEHFAMENRHPVRAGNLADFAKDPEFVHGEEFVEQQTAGAPKGPKLLSIYPDYDYSKGHKWAMAIDLNTCTGCGACTVACQAENNIAVVGKEGVLRSREMHWIRIDRYFKGAPNEPESVTQPMPCQQCENAPCEQVCPVGATTHSPEGLNDMAYNRCIGTKYCLNNCPFKVRRFNYFHYTKNLPELRQAQFNPDVTIRSRGVMEKCTYCVQRINSAKIDAHKAGTEHVADGAIKTACQQVCPAGAITFGDLNDPKSAVVQLKSNSRSYVLLEEINVRARTTYLARIQNPNPEIA